MCTNWIQALVYVHKLSWMQQYLSGLKRYRTLENSRSWHLFHALRMLLLKYFVIWWLLSDLLRSAFLDKGLTAKSYCLLKSSCSWWDLLPRKYTKDWILKRSKHLHLFQWQLFAFLRNQIVMTGRMGWQQWSAPCTWKRMWTSHYWSCISWQRIKMTPM